MGGFPEWDMNLTSGFDIFFDFGYCSVQPYTYYCVIDVEGTCEKDADWDFPNEIIEFPVVLIDGQSTKIVSIRYECGLELGRADRGMID